MHPGDFLGAFCEFRENSRKMEALEFLFFWVRNSQDSLNAQVFHFLLVLVGLRSFWHVLHHCHSTTRHFVEHLSLVVWIFI
jgi:hypothetical protein